VEASLAGRVALVTGAAHRLGAACVRALAREGVSVVVHCRHSVAAVAALCREVVDAGGQAVWVQADLADAVAAGRLFQQALEPFGPISILVNNASSFRPGRLEDTTVSRWQDDFAVHVQAPFLLMQAFAAQPEVRAARDQGGAPVLPWQIVNLIDSRVLRPQPGHLSYTVTKSALWSLTRVAALELAPVVRVNAIGPGAILPAADATPEQFARIAAQAPLGVPGGVEDIVEALMFLLRHRYMTGEMLCIDGGAHL
jgi:NAD(P)-dependent dehydrogenase (short-subunit alcohol dehydrogenase family)